MHRELRRQAMPVGYKYSTAEARIQQQKTFTLENLLSITMNIDGAKDIKVTYIGQESQRLRPTGGTIVVGTAIHTEKSTGAGDNPSVCCLFRFIAFFLLPQSGLWRR